MKRNFAILVASLMAMGSMGAAQADVLTVILMVFVWIFLKIL